MSLTYETSHRLFAEARQVLPGGVDSPVRAYQSVGLEPPFIARGEGSHIIDVDGNDYVDYVDSWGPLILGHNHPAIREAVISAASRGLSFGAPVAGEADLARLMCRMVPGLEMVRFVNSGTEAVMSALRLARAATRRDKVIKFEGCYHARWPASSSSPCARTRVSLRRRRAFSRACASCVTRLARCSSSTRSSRGSAWLRAAPRSASACMPTW